MKKMLALVLLLLSGLVTLALAPAGTERWSRRRPTRWYATQPWLVGSNYIPATAINELEMWQADTFDPKPIDKELGWAEGLGMKTMRVFLHDLPWTAGRERLSRANRPFLDIAAKHQHQADLRALRFVLGSASRKLGPQRAPTPGVHNSGWVQSPGAKSLQDPADYAQTGGLRHRRGRPPSARTSACSAGTCGTSPTT